MVFCRYRALTTYTVAGYSQRLCTGFRPPAGKSCRKQEGPAKRKLAFIVEEIKQKVYGSVMTWMTAYLRTFWPNWPSGRPS